MSLITNSVALTNAAQPKGQLPAGPAYLYGFGMLAVLVLVIVLHVIETARERRRRGPTAADLRKQWEDERFTRALMEAAREPAHHSVPERYRKKP